MNKPKVSIGMPVCNGGNYISDALDSFLAQTYSDFELIISDNASSDNTETICRSYARKDRRIRYYRNQHNEGAAENFNRVFNLARGEYFKWAAHDDVVAPDFLEKSVKILDKNPSVVLCFSKVRIINKDGCVIQDCECMGEKIGSLDRCKRFCDLVLNDRFCFDVFGLIRTKIMKKTLLIAPYVASDRLFRAELGLRGVFYEIPEYLFFLRDHGQRSVRALPAHHLRGEWFHPDNRGKIIFPHWRIFAEYYRCVQRVGLDFGEKIRCYLCILRWLWVDWNLLRMLADVIIAFNPWIWNLCKKTMLMSRGMI